MDGAQLSETLLALTGGWSSPRGDAAALDEARRAVGATLATGGNAGSVRISPTAFTVRPSAGAESAIATLASSLQSGAAPPVRAFVRSALDLDPSSLSAVAGMKVEKTLGPFLDPIGIEHFVDLLPTARQIPINGPSGLLGVLLLDKIPVVPPLPTPVKPVKIGAGALWISLSALLGGTKPGFVGVEFSDGTIELQDVATSPAGTLTLKAGSRLGFKLSLAHTAPAIGPSSIGGDAIAMSVTLPPQAAILFEAAGATIAAVDDSSATLYATGFNLTRNSAKPAMRDYGSPYLLVPSTASIASFAVGSCVSTDFILSGEAPVKGCGWALPVTTAAEPDLGVPDGAGALALELGPGVNARFGDFPAPVLLADAALLVKPASITIVAHTGKRDLRSRLTLWNPPPAGARQAIPPPIRSTSTLDLTYPRGALVTVVIAPSSESVRIACSLLANLDRPLAADGSRLPLTYTAGFAGFIDDPTGKRMIVSGASPPSSARNHVIALENALVGVAPSTALAFLGSRSEPGWSGRLGIALPMRGFVPTLPDPYAASFGAQQLIDRTVAGSLVASMTWTVGQTPDLVFSAADSPANLQGGFTLLDVSTNVDIFGVAALSDAPTCSIAGMTLEAADRELAVYTLPGISWEPVVNDVPPQPVDWQNAFSDDDGPATLLRTASVDLVRVEPAVLLPHFQRTANSALTRADFTLPFGLMAHLQTTPETDPNLLPAYQFNNAAYKSGVECGTQLSIIANPKSFIPHSSNAVVPPDPTQLSGPALPGFTTTGSVAKPPNPAIYGIQVLGFQPLDAGFFFDQQFAEQSQGGKYPGIPVSRIDLSGYGASMFSDWHHQDIHFVGVVRSRFDVLVGRTSYELLTLQSVIVPWSIRITRSIIFDRSDAGLVLKHDTGWKPVGLGAFELLNPAEVIGGAVQNVGNVRNLRIGAGPTLSATGADTGRTVDFVPVTFDADLNLNFAQVSALTNGRSNVAPACTGIQGYAQVTVGATATHDELLALMDKLGPPGVTGQLGTILSVGALGAAPQFTSNISSLRVASTSARAAGKPYPAAVGVALNGVPRLPRDGAWSISRRNRTTQTPTAVDPASPVPLVRAGGKWRLLDPIDAASPDSPATFYGVLQGAGTSKTLFEHTIIDDGGRSLNIDPAHLPNLADVGALLGASDIFPNLGAVLSLNTSANPLNLVADGFKQTYEQDINQPDRTIFSLGIVKLVLAYHAPDGTPTHVKFTLDPASSPRWSLDITNLSFQALVDGFGSDPLLTITGGFAGSETSPPGVKDIAVEYGSALSFVEAVFSGLGPLIQSVGGEVDLDVGFSKNHLSVRDYLAVPEIPLGFGDIHDVTIDLGFDAVIPSSAGFHVGLGSRDKPFEWLVSPLSGTGAIVLGVDHGDLDVYIEAGIGAGLEINLAVASGAASITLELAFEIDGGAISVAAALMGHAEVDVLGGLASASLTLTAGITLTPHPALPAFPPDDIELTAEVAVGIHISICWVVSIDFDGSWQFSQDVPVNIL